MKTTTIRDLRSNFARICAWLEQGETIQLLKQGQPFARIVPEATAERFLGRMAGTAKVPYDIDKPLGLEWEAMK